MKVLIAEDDLTSRQILESLLKKWHYDVIAVENGTDALEKLQAADAPRLAVLDWMMPGLDGVEVCQRVRESDVDEPPYIILLTAQSNKNDVVAGLAAGADDYIVKPFDYSELQARIEVGVRVIKLQRDLATRIADLQDALEHVKTLQGLLPICMHCKSIRTDEKSWEKIEGYIAGHSDAQFTHGLCPECLEKYYPELTKK
ncbi:MAG: response regulator transcription factor [Candidatus Eisenbacteria bacterium]